MNERIRDLEKQATTIEYGIDNGFDRVTFDKEKFALLIVQECANEILKWKSEPFPFDPDFAAKTIKQHFGVER